MTPFDSASHDGRGLSAALVVLCVALLGPQGRLCAQSQGVGAVLSGRVAEAGDTIGLAGAEVEIVGAAMRQHTNRAGLFRFAEVPPGSYEVRVRLLGYQPATLRVALEQGRSYKRDVALQRLPRALTEVRIEGRLLPVPTRFEDVYRRAARGAGKFFTRQDIEQLNPYDVKSLLGTVPTVQVNDRGITFQRCQAGMSGLSAVGSLQQRRSSAGDRPGGVQPAKVQVYINGTRMTGRSGLDSASKVDEVNDVLRLVHPRDIEAMEVYTGVARIPVEFLDDACAVVAIWTKSY